MKLSTAIRRAGFGVVVDPKPWRHPDRLGRPSRGTGAAALKGDRIAICADQWEHAYSASHEIAESIHGFRHCELMWTEQANILAAWHAMRSGGSGKPCLPVWRGARRAGRRGGG